MGALIKFLANIAVGWFIPLLGAAILFPFLQIVVLINHWVGGSVTLIVLGLLIWHTISHHQSSSWQLFVWIATLLPAAALAFLSPFYFQLWSLFLETIVLLVLLGIPGVVLPSWRGRLSGLVGVEILFTLLLGGFIMAKSSGILISSSVGVIVVLLLISSTIFFFRTGRPYEIRNAQRRISRWALLIAILLLVISFGWPLIRGTTFIITGHDPELEYTVAKAVIQSKHAVKKVSLSPTGASATHYTGDYQPFYHR